MHFVYNFKTYSTHVQLALVATLSDKYFLKIIDLGLKKCIKPYFSTSD